MPIGSRSPPQPASQLWGMIHGIFLLLGTVTVMIGFAAGVLYLVQASRLKRKLPPPAGLRLPSLEWLERVNSRVVVISALILVAIGFLAGVVLNLAARGDGELSWSDPVISSSALMLAWLVAAALFKRPVQAGPARPQSGLSDRGQLWLFGVGLGRRCCWSTRGHGGQQRPTRSSGPATQRPATTPARWAMKLQMIGCSHHRTGVEARERLAFDADQAGVGARRFAAAISRRPRRCCCRPAIGWRFTPPPRIRLGVPSHEEMAQFMADFHGLPIVRDF